MGADSSKTPRLSFSSSLFESHLDGCSIMKAFLKLLFCLEFPDEILIVVAFEATALAVNWRAGTCGDREIEVRFCAWEGETAREKKGWVCVCGVGEAGGGELSVRQQLYSNCSCWFVCKFDGVLGLLTCVCVFISTVVCACVFIFESFGPSLQRNSISAVSHQSVCLIPGVDKAVVCVCVCVCSCVWVCECALLVGLCVFQPNTCQAYTILSLPNMICCLMQTICLLAFSPWNIFWSDKCCQTWILFLLIHWGIILFNWPQTWLNHNPLNWNTVI